MVFVNASVLIPLAKTGKLGLLKKYFNKIKISEGISQELIGFDKPGANEIENALHLWIINEGQPKQLQSAKQLAEAEKISTIDAELLLLAQQQKEKILTNDYRLHAVAKTKQVETEWLTTFLLKCTKKKILTKKQAKETLFELVQTGMRLSLEVYSAIEQEIDKF